MEIRLDRGRRVGSILILIELLSCRAGAKDVGRARDAAAEAQVASDAG